MAGDLIYDAHENLLCGAKLRSGRVGAGGDSRCHRRAGAGTEHVGSGACRNHGGNTKTHLIAAVRAEADRVLPALGLPVQVDPEQGMLDLLAISAGAVAWYGLKVGTLTETSGTSLGWVSQERESLLDVDTGKDGTLWRKASPWVSLYNEERDRMLSIAKACISAGIAERKVKLAENQGAQVFEATRRFIESTALNLTPEQRARAPQVMRDALLAVDAIDTGSRLADPDLED